MGKGGKYLLYVYKILKYFDSEGFIKYYFNNGIVQHFMWSLVSTSVFSISSSLSVNTCVLGIKGSSIFYYYIKSWV